jgi:hypothetical protein
MDQRKSCPKINTVNRFIKKALLSQARLSTFNTNAVKRQHKYNNDVMEN